MTCDVIPEQCVCVRENLREWGQQRRQETKPQDSGVCIHEHTQLTNELLVSCCFVVSQSNVILYNITNTLTSHLTSQVGWCDE